MDEKKVPVPQQVVEFISLRTIPPTAEENPETEQVLITPARYNFSGPHADEFERISRAAAAASGIVQTPEEMTARLQAEIQAAKEAEAQAEAAPPGTPAQ